MWNNRREGYLVRGLEYFEKAAARDPKYALAYAGIADSYSIMASLGYDVLPVNVAMPKAQAAALHAVELDPSLAEAHVSLAYVKLMYEWDWRGSEKEFKRAIELNPNYPVAHLWYAHDLWATGHTDDSTRELQTAVELDPASLAVITAVGRQHYLQGQFQQSVEQYKKAMQFDPRFVPAHLSMALVYEQMGQSDKSLEEIETAQGSWPIPIL